jgi:hypothetical protein
LQRVGVPFVVISDRRGLVAASRRVENHAVAPGPRADPDGFVSAVETVVARTGARVEVPTFDDALHVCNVHREALADLGARVAAASRAAVANVLDKQTNLETAARVGIPIPTRFELDDDGGVSSTREPTFPIIVKRATPHQSSSARPAPPKWHIARDGRELREVLAMHPPDEPPILQERLRGEIVGVYCFAVNGEIVAACASRAIRRGGQNVLRETVPVPTDLLGYTTSMLRELA